MPAEFHTNGPEETRALARRLAPALAKGACVALVGELGAGKTCFVQGLAEGLGGDPDAVSSPTFVISCEHPCGDQAQLAHVDAFRLGAQEELATIGWTELVADPMTYVAVEWADRIVSELPDSCIEVRIEHIGEDLRRIVMTWPQAAGAVPDWIQSASVAGTCIVCQVPLEATAGPFCSQRCQMADLGRWFSGRYVLPRPLEETDWEAES